MKLFFLGLATVLSLPAFAISKYHTPMLIDYYHRNQAPVAAVIADKAIVENWSSTMTGFVIAQVILNGTVICTDETFDVQKECGYKNVDLGLDRYLTDEDSIIVTVKTGFWALGKSLRATFVKDANTPFGQSIYIKRDTSNDELLVEH